MKVLALIGNSTPLGKESVKGMIKGQKHGLKCFFPNELRQSMDSLSLGVCKELMGKADKKKKKKMLFQNCMINPTKERQQML